MVDLGHVQWVLPLARQAYENREHISSAWEQFRASFGKRSTLAVTGLPGVGKTVLCDFLSGTAYQKGYRAPGKSTDTEYKNMKAKRLGIRLSIVPGQKSPNKLAGLDELFDGELPVDGVIYVVANGFSEIRPDSSKQFARTRTLQEYREAIFQEEIEDLGEICERIRKSLRQTGKPTWLLIAVNKIDLYYDSIDEAKDRYSSMNTPFTERIRRLSDQVGSDNFSWEVLPVCSKLDDFSSDNNISRSQFRESDREFYIDQFAKKLVKLCNTL